MTLEEKLRGMAAKGELVHCSIGWSGRLFRATFTAATPAAGYGKGEHASDPVAALEAAIADVGVKPKRITAPVKRPDGEGIPTEAFEGVHAITEPEAERVGELPSWMT